MKQNQDLASIFSTVLLLILISSNTAFAQNPVNKAEEFMQKEKFINAIKLLKKELKEDPENAEIHFQLGTCYVSTGYYAEANKLFLGSIRLNPDYAKKVGILYLNVAIKELRKGNIRKSRILFQKAIKSNDGLRKVAAKEAFHQGERLFYAGKYNQADARFSVANSIDDSYADKICDMYFDLGNSLPEQKCLNFYSIAAWYCRKHDEEIGIRLLKIAKSHTSKESVEKFKSEAAKYVSKETIETVFPNPSWKTVHTYSYIGKGCTNNNDIKYQIPTVKFGEQVKPGDRLVVEADGAFKIWDAGWEEYVSRCEIIFKNTIQGEYFYVQGPKDRRIVVKVQRYY